MKELSTDLDRDFASLPDDPQATKERIVTFFSCLAMGIVFGVIGTMFYYAVIGKPCSAAPYCSVHKVI